LKPPLRIAMLAAAALKNGLVAAAVLTPPKSPHTST
jgi:hypothetical protein